MTQAYILLQNNLLGQVDGGTRINDLRKLQEDDLKLTY